MPQHRVGRSNDLLSRALVAVLVAIMAGGYVQLAVQPPARAAAAARTALAAAQPLLPASAVVTPVGGADGWQTGTIAIPARSDVEGDEPRVFLYVAHRQGMDWTAAIEGTNDFVALAGEARAALSGTASADLLATALDTTSGDGSAALSLPWASGKTWRLTGGPHPHSGNSRPWGALDFAGPRPGMSVKVRAARGGIVVRPCGSLVQIRHAGGWTTSYYHLRKISVRAGQSVSRGQVIGRTSSRATCGGRATGPHVHFSLLRYGSVVNLRGHVLGGWKVKEGSSAYQGCLVKNGVKRCAPGGSIYNDGSIGSK
jgi:LasA protease